MSELASYTLTPTGPGLTPPTTMVLEGEIGRSELPDIDAMLERLCARGVCQVVLDLSEVTHFDFRGVKLLIARAHQLRAHGGDLKLAGLSSYLHAIFRSAGGHGAFDYYPDAQQAAAACAAQAVAH